MAEKKVKQPNEEKKPLGPEFIELKRFAATLSFVESEVWNRSRTTTKSLQSRKLTKDELLFDLEDMVTELQKAGKKAEQIIIKYPQYSPLTTSALVLVKRLWDLLEEVYFYIETSEDIELCYKYTVRTYKRTSGICDELGKLSSRLGIEVSINPPTGETVGSYMSLHNFMKLHCGEITPDKLKSAKRVLLRINKDILPLPKKKDKKNSPFKYKENELIANWPKLRKINPSLPELKL